MENSSELFACSAPRHYDVESYRQDFPILAQKVNGYPLAYLDNGASTQKPRMVIEAMTRFMENDYANIHRGLHHLSIRASHAFEGARERVRRFINAEKSQEIIFTRGGTESINLVASTWGAQNLKAGDEVILTVLEHHANIVPWQMLRDKIGIILKVVPITPSGDIEAQAVMNAVTARTKLISIAHISNVLGTILPVQEIIKFAHSKHIIVLLDGCQAVAHQVVDVRDLDADFYVFSSHKLYGPTGIGVLYGKYDILKTMPPYQGGGDMISSVTFEKTTYQDPPYRFEAGTPAITEAIGLAAAIDYISTIGISRIAKYEHSLTLYAREKLQSISGLHILGNAQHQSGIISFTMDGAHPHDISTIVDSMGVAIRAGHHCAQPLMDFLNIPASARASVGLYTTHQDVDALIAGLQKVRGIF